MVLTASTQSGSSPSSLLTLNITVFSSCSSKSLQGMRPVMLVLPIIRRRSAGAVDSTYSNQKQRKAATYSSWHE